MSVSLHHCSILIQPTTTQAQWSFFCQYLSTIAPNSFIHLPHFWREFFSQCFTFPCKYYSTIAPHLFIHLPHMLYRILLPVLQFSLVSIISPLLHTLSNMFLKFCIICFSQDFNFLLSLTYHHCSVLFHPPSTHTLKFFLWVLKFSAFSITPPLFPLIQPSPTHAV
jgi:hypothetical protein